MTIQKTALVRAVAAAAMLCLAGASAQAVDLTATQLFSATGPANNINGTVSLVYELGPVTVGGSNNGLYENPVLKSMSFVGSYINPLNVAVPVNFSAMAPLNAPFLTGGDWVLNNTDNTLADFQAGIAVAAQLPSMAIQWVAGAKNGFAAGEPLLNAQNAGNVFGNLTIFDGALNTIASGDSQRYVNIAVAAAPIPEASTYLMMLAGIAGVAAAVRRRAV